MVGGRRRFRNARCELGTVSMDDAADGVEVAVLEVKTEETVDVGEVFGDSVHGEGRFGMMGEMR